MGAWLELATQMGDQADGFARRTEVVITGAGADPVDWPPAAREAHRWYDLVPCPADLTAGATRLGLPLSTAVTPPSITQFWILSKTLFRVT